MRPTIDSETTKAEAKMLREIYQSKRKELGITQERIACEGLGARSQSAVSHYMSGKTPLTIQSASVFARYLEVPIGAFSPRLAKEVERMARDQAAHAPTISTQDIKTRTEFIYPILGQLSKGSWNTQDAEAEPLWPSSRKDAGKNGFWLSLDSDSMIAANGEGFPVNCLLLLGSPPKTLEPGKLYVFRLENGQAVFRMVTSEAGDLYLKPHNPSYRTIPFHHGISAVGEVLDARIIIR